jgi:hypothetical protein
VRVDGLHVVKGIGVPVHSGHGFHGPFLSSCLVVQITRCELLIDVPVEEKDATLSEASQRLPVWQAEHP